MDGLAVTTVEGIGSTATKLHPVQERIAKSHGSQCGFCTPGIVMSMYTLLRNTPKPTAHEVEDAFQGNLCRCTGYRPILDAFKTFCVESSPATDSHMANGNQDSALLASTINSTAVPSNNSSSATDSGSIAPSTFECPMGEACCKNNKDKQNDCSTMTDVHGLKSHQYKEGDRLTVVGHSALTRGLVFTPFDPSQEPIFPPAFKNAAHPTYKKCLKVVGEHVTWFRPTTLASLLELKRHHPHARLVVGNTEIGIETKFKHQVYKHLFHTSYLPELNIFKVSQDGVHVGASVCLTDFGAQLTQLVSTLPSYKTRTFTAILENLRWFAGHQIRNVGCVGGNIVTASPISDLNPVFMAANSVLTVASAKNGERQIPFSEFYKSYRRTALEHDEVLVSVFIPFTKQYEYVEAFKQAKRREDDIAIVNAGMRVRLKFLPLSCLTPSTASSVSSTPTSTNDTTEELVPVIEELAVSYGGMAPTTVLSKSTSQALVGKVFDESIVPVACETLASDLPLATSAPGGMIEYRRALSTSFFFKFYLMVVDSLKQDLLKNVATTTTSSTTNTTTTTTTAAIIADGAAAANPRYRVPSLTNTQKSAIERVHRPTSSSIQEYQVPLQVEHEHDQVGTPVQHLSAEKQATGEAVYVDDIPRFSNELYAGIVFSQRAHAKILSVNTSAALKIDGVFAYYGAKDVPGSNKFPIVAEDEVCFADGVVTCVGQIIGVVLATTQAIAQYAARQVVVEYQELKPIVTIEDAIEAESFYSPINKFEVGNVEEALANSPVVIEGEFKMGGQEHFYLETQASLAIPHREDGELEIYASTQNPNKTQMTIAKVLGVNASKINCRTKRAGGGFGGKETRSVLVSAVCAVAAHLSKRPVRCMLDRDEDMTSSGQRHPFMARYKVGADKDGILKALDLKMYSNGGNTLDLSMSVMERALFSLDNVYNIPVLRGMGYVCKTNLPSYTAFRGFGAPQGMAIVETWMTHLASVLGLDNNTIRERNFYKEGDLTHFKQALVDCHVQKTWNIALQNSRFATRRAECDKFNSENRWKKRGLAIIPTKFGISFTAKFLNQAGALVHVSIFFFFF